MQSYVIAASLAAASSQQQFLFSAATALLAAVDIIRITWPWGHQVKTLWESVTWVVKQWVNLVGSVQKSKHWGPGCFIQQGHCRWSHVM